MQLRPIRLPSSTRTGASAVDAITENSGLGADATVAQFLDAVENYYRKREAQGAAFEKPKSKEEADRLEGRNADLKRQRDDATDDVIKNLNKNLSDLERTTSTLSGKTLTQAHGLSSDQILEQTLPTIKKAYDELEQKSIAIIKEEIARRQALGEQTADLDKKLADKQAEIGSKRQAALTTGLEAYERQAKQEVGSRRQEQTGRTRPAAQCWRDGRRRSCQRCAACARQGQGHPGRARAGDLEAEGCAVYHRIHFGSGTADRRACCSRGAARAGHEREAGTRRAGYHDYCRVYGSQTA